MASTARLERPPERDSWFAPFSVDLILKVLNVTFFHPFVAWMVPLCFRAEHMDWDKIPIRVAIWYATFITVCWTLGQVNRRWAFGIPREVNLEDEVIVITGGASGLGLLIAEVYGMRGASVAVLDVREMENGEARGVTYYKCDVANKDELARVSRQIEEDVSKPLYPAVTTALAYDTSSNVLPAWNPHCPDQQCRHCCRQTSIRHGNRRDREESFHQSVLELLYAQDVLTCHDPRPERRYHCHCIQRHR